MTFEKALAKYVNGIREKVNEAFANNPHIAPKVYSTINRKYVRIVKEDKSGNRSVHSFIDIKSGNVLKAASWRAPAKYARGNIFNEDNGLDCASAYGVATFRNVY